MCIRDSYDVTGKICPNPYVYNTTKHTWDAFKKAIAESGTEDKDSMKMCIRDRLWRKRMDGAS